MPRGTVERGAPTRLYHARQLRGLSQAELAQQADVSQTYLSELERGLSSPNVLIAQRLAGVLEMAVAELWPPDEA